MPPLHGILCVQTIMLTKTWTGISAACTKQKTHGALGTRSSSPYLLKLEQKHSFRHNRESLAECNKPKCRKKTPSPLETPQALSQIFQLAQKWWIHLCGELTLLCYSVSLCVCFCLYLCSSACVCTCLLYMYVWCVSALWIEKCPKRV